MGMIINIDQALKQRTHYNVLREPLHEMLQNQQEAWEKQNPIDFLFVRRTMDTFQQTYTSQIGFDHAFVETNDYAVGPIFNTAEGFSATFRTRTFQGGFIITRQALEDAQLNHIKDDASAFMRAWHRDIVKYCMTAISGGFGTPVYFGNAKNGGRSKISLYSADTVDGEIDNPVKNPLFYKEHTCVKREGMAATDVKKQSNVFASKIDLLGSDPAKIAKLADVINQVIKTMENYYDDNGEYAGVQGKKEIVCGNDPHLIAALNTALSMDMFHQGESQYINPAYKMATVNSTPYLNDIPQCKDGVGFFIIDKEYNASNHGLEFTERIPLTLEAFDKREAPQGIKYEGRQRFDVNVASWRGIVYVYIGETSSTATDWNYTDKFTAITPAATIVKPVSVVGAVETN